MKKIIKVLLFIVMSSILLFGCNSSKEKENVADFINKLISTETYENINFNDDVEILLVHLNSAFDNYLTDNALNLLLANRIPSIYSTVISKNNITDITDMEITQVKENKYDSYTHYEYEVTYKLKSDNDSIDMTDYMSFKILKDNLIDEVYLLDKKSSIFDVFKNHL